MIRFTFNVKGFVKSMSRFCKAPWMNIQLDVNGSIRPCCRYKQHNKQTDYKMPNIRNKDLIEVWQGDEMQKLRKAFIDGDEPDECEWCWTEEDSGIRSFRQSYNARPYDVDTSSIYADPPVMFDLKLSNVCNFKCRMCGPTASSMILKEMKSQGKKFPHESYYVSNKILGTPNEKMFFDDLIYVKEIELTGGEPFFSAENKKLIQKIAQAENAPNIKIHITTNGSIYDTKTLDALATFERVTLALSIDDIGPRLEYQRSGAVWDTIRSNVDKIKSNYPQFKIDAYRTINIFNIWYLKELDDYCVDNNINLVSGLLHEPSYLSIKNLHSYAKSEIGYLYETSHEYKYILQFMARPPEDNIDMSVKIEHLDKIRGESFGEVFKEWSEVLNIT